MHSPSIEANRRLVLDQPLHWVGEPTAHLGLKASVIKVGQQRRVRRCCRQHNLLLP
jgi:hypothetical protein